MLNERREVLLNGLAEYLLEKDSENIVEGVIPADDIPLQLTRNWAYRTLLCDARLHDIPRAWAAFLRHVQEIAAGYRTA